MMTVKTVVGPSSIHGRGVIAAEDIQKGTIVWRLNPEVDEIYDLETFSKMNAEDQAFIKRHGYKEKNLIVLGGDNDRYTNHSDKANTITLSPTEIAAACFIAKGEEITMNYWEYDDFAAEKLSGALPAPSAPSGDTGLVILSYKIGGATA